MKPDFSLQNVLDVRHDRVEAFEIKLSILLSQQMNAQKLLEELRAYSALLMDRLMKAQSGEMDLTKVSLLRSNMLTVDDQLILARAEINRLEREIEKMRSDLIKARQDEETLQTLKRKRIEFYNLELAQAEAKAQDDIYISQAYRQRLVEVSAL
jgi:flagellar export protein FliJ